MRILSTLYLSLSLLLIQGTANAQSDQPQGIKLPELTNFSELAQRAKAKNLPITLMFSAQWCEFCGILKEEVLDPMTLSGQYEDKFTFLRLVSLDDSDPFIGPNNQSILKSKWAYQLGADLTPTVLFVDWQGKEVGERIIGIANIELYSTLIHKSLNQAYKKLNNPLRIDAIKPQAIN